MPQDIQIRKNNATLDDSSPKAYIPDVAADFRHIEGARVDPMPIMRALNGISDFFGKKADQQAKKQSDADAQQGIRDANTNAVDAARMERSEAYRAAVNSTAGQRRAVEWYNSKSKELDQLQRQNPNMDLQAWMSQARSELYGGQQEGVPSVGNDPHMLKALNDTANQLQSNLSSQFTARQTKMEHDAAETNFGGKALALVQAAGYKLSGDDVDNIIKSGPQSGLTEQESRDTLGKVLAAQMGDGHPELYEAVTGSKAQLHLDGNVGDNLQKAYRMGQAVQKKQQEEANLVHGEELFRVSSQAMMQARTGSFGMAQAMALQGKVPDHQLNSWMEMSERHNMTMAEQAAQRSQAQALVNATNQQVDQVLGHDQPAKFLGMTTADGKEVTNEVLKKGVDRGYQNADRAMDAALSSGDPRQVQQAQAVVASYLQKGIQLGYTPEALTMSLNAATPTNPRAFVDAVKKAQAYKSAGLWDYVSGALHHDQTAALNMAMDQLANGQDEKSVVQMMTQSPLKPHEAFQLVKADKKTLDAAVADVTKQSDNGGFLGFGRSFDPAAQVGDYAIRQTIETRASAYAARGMGASAAITAAQNDVKQQYAIVGGIPFNKASTALVPDFADRFGDYAKDVVRPKLIEQYGPSVAHAMQLSIAPDPREPGSFYLISTNTGGAAPLRDKEGSYIRFSQNEMLNQVIKAKEAKDRAAAEAAKSPFTSGLNVLQ